MPSGSTCPRAWSVSPVLPPRNLGPAISFSWHSASQEPCHGPTRCDHDVRSTTSRAVSTLQLAHCLPYNSHRSSLPSCLRAGWAQWVLELRPLTRVHPLRVWVRPVPGLPSLRSNFGSVSPVASSAALIARRPPVSSGDGHTEIGAQPSPMAPTLWSPRRRVNTETTRSSTSHHSGYVRAGLGRGALSSSR